MTNFLFWNIHKQPIIEVVANLVAVYEVDVLMLVECLLHPRDVQVALNKLTGPVYQHKPNLDPKTEICVFSRLEGSSFRPRLETSRYTIWHVQLSRQEDLLLVVAHLHSKLYMTENDQYEESRQLAKEIRNVEKEIGHSRTILVGDLNMNPFDRGLAGTIGLQAVMSQELAKGESREIDEEKYPFFYNPMWSLFGDLTPGPPGTYYYDKRERYLRYYWHMFDQVLIRPSLLDRFSSRDLKILTSIGNLSLMSPTNGRPSLSDHLPIFFKLV